MDGERWGRGGGILRCALLFGFCCAAARAQDDRAAALADASVEAAATDGTLSLLLAREAFQALDTEASRTALYAALAEHRERAVFRGHTAPVVFVDLSPDGQAVATASEDKTVRLWTAKGAQTAVIQVGAPVREVRFVGSSVLAVTDAELLLFDRAGAKLAVFPRSPFDVEGPMLALSPKPDALRLADANGKVVRELKVKGFGPAAGDLTFYAVTADGKLRWYDSKGVEKMVSPAAGTTRAVFARSAPVVASFGTGIHVELWSPQCKKLGELLHGGGIEQVAMSPSGDRIFTASSDGNYAFFGLDGKRQQRVPKPGPCHFAAVSDDGLRVVTLDDTDRVTVWTWDAVPVTKRFPGVVRVQTNARCGGLILDFKDGTRKFVHSGLEEVNSAALLSGALSWSGWCGEWLFVGDDAGHGALQHWYGAGPGALLGHGGAILHACFSADDALVATASRDGTARLWDADPLGVPVLHHPDKLTGLSYIPGRLVTVSRAALLLREPSGRLVKEIPLVSPMIWWGQGDDRIAVTCKDELQAVLYDGNGKELGRMKHDGVVNGVEVAPKGDVIVTFSKDKTAKLWDGRGKARATLPHPGAVESAAFSADGSLVLTTADDRQGRIWTAAGKLQATFPVPEEVWYCLFSPTGDRIVGIPNKSTVARVWGPRGEPVAELKGHEKPIVSAAFSLEGDAIVTGSQDGTARLWDKDGHPGPALMHPDAVYKGAFLPGGAGLVTTCKDGAVRHWSREGRLLAVLHGHVKAVWFVECSKDGATLATASEDTTVRLWPLKHDDLLRIAKERSCRDFTPEERDRFGALLGK